jgi:DinB superfamily
MNDYSSQIAQLTKGFTEAFGQLSTEQLNWKPNAQTWSIAQNINHLIVVGESYYPIFDALKEGNYKPPFIAKIGFIVSFFEKIILGAVQPDRSKKMKTFPIWEPTNGALPADILTQYEAFHATLQTYFTDLAALAQKGVVISSAVNKNIVYRLEIAFEIIITHEHRHLAQAKEILTIVPTTPKS